MRQHALDVFPAFTERLEGKVTWMYLDILGLVTTGLGCLIDPMSLAIGLPWVTKLGVPARTEDVIAEWHTVKDMTSLAKQGHRIAEKFTRLRLTDDGVAELAKRRLDANEAIFRKTWPQWDEFPADAQLAIMSMGWAMGAGFVKKFLAFTAAVAKQDWLAAAANCHIRETGNAGIIPRNKLNKRLFAEAAWCTNPDVVTMFAPKPSAFSAQVSVPWVGITDEAWAEMTGDSASQLERENG